MKRDLRKITLLTLLALFGAGFLFVNSVQAGIVKFGDKNIFADFNGLPFNLSNWVPGTSTPLKTISITNDENFDINVYFAATTSNDNILADVLTVTIGDKSEHLSDLFNSNIFLGSVNSGKFQDYNIIIKFDENAGDKYQNQFINFDFIITVKEIGGGNGGILPVIIPGGGYPGQYVTTTTIPPTTTTTIPGEVAGEATKREFFEDGGEEGLPETTTTTTTTITTILPSGFVAGISTIGPFSCPVNLVMSGINPLLASLLCLGQNACDTCLNPLIILLLGIGIIIIALYLAATKLLNNWIAFIIALAVIVYLLLFVLGVCLSPWLIFIIGLVAIIVAFLISRLKRE